MGSTSKQVTEAYERAVNIICPADEDQSDRSCLPPTWNEQERPDHTVTLAPYYIDIYEVTQGQFSRYQQDLDPGAPDMEDSSANRNPQSGVSWLEADDYCRKLHKQLPTEAQWEKAARSAKDERHVCPLQLPLIDRVVRLWSNPGEIVLSPFMGIGSEGYQSLKRNRRFMGIELNPRYYGVARKNLTEMVESRNRQPSLFALGGE